LGTESASDVKYCTAANIGGRDAAYNIAFDTTKDVIIDAAVGRICRPPRALGARDVVNVVVINMNPFIYDYHVGVVTSVITETAPVFFFQQLLGGIDLSQVGKLDLLKTQTPNPQLFGELGHVKVKCDDVTQTLVAQELVDRYYAVVEQHSQITAISQPRKKEVDSLAALYRRASDVWSDPRSTTVLVVPAARESARLDSAIGIAAGDVNARTKGLVPVFLAKSRIYLQAADAAQTASPGLRACKIEPVENTGPTTVGQLLDREYLVQRDTVELPLSLTSLQAKGDGAQKDLDRITTVFKEPRRFFQVRRLGPHSSSSKDSITVDRRVIPSTSSAANDGGTAAGSTSVGGSPPKAKTNLGGAPDPPSSTPDAGTYTTIATTLVRFGPDRFLSIGAGLAFTDIPARQFVPVKRYQASVAPADTVISVIGLSQDDSRRMTPMLTLNGRLFDACELASALGHLFHSLKSDQSIQGAGCDVVSGMSAVLGATVSKPSQTNLEYFEGLGLNLFDGRLTIAGGYYTGLEQRLAAGYSLNQRIPNGQPPPTITKYLWRPAIQAGFRIY
jgi:hypothetical protein